MQLIFTCSQTKHNVLGKKNYILIATLSMEQPCILLLLNLIITAAVKYETHRKLNLLMYLFIFLLFF